jgi:hypothetical protein
MYLTSHDTLLSELTKLKGKIDYVFNLCDEGYYNDARNELHISALLDVLKIPYTGAGPQCLAFCYDKSLVRGIAKEMDIPVPEAIFIKPGDDDPAEILFDCLRCIGPLGSYQAIDKQDRLNHPEPGFIQVFCPLIYVLAIHQVFHFFVLFIIITVGGNFLLCKYFICSFGTQCGHDIQTCRHESGYTVELLFIQSFAEFIIIQFHCFG